MGRWRLPPPARLFFTVCPARAICPGVKGPCGGWPRTTAIRSTGVPIPQFGVWTHNHQLCYMLIASLPCVECFPSIGPIQRGHDLTRQRHQASRAPATPSTAKTASATTANPLEQVVALARNRANMDRFVCIGEKPHEGWGHEWRI